MVVCICGMHRSGTSMVSNTLSRCGIYLGPEEVLKRAANDNELGFWENDAFVQLNDELLRLMFAGWDSPPVRFHGWEDAPQLEPLRERARKLIAEHAEHPVWGWKDPRSSLTLPFWQALIPDLKIVLCLRNPLEVAQSLQRRNFLSIPFGVRLWYTYQSWALAATDPGTRMVTHYDTHFVDAQGEIRRLLDFLCCRVSDDLLAEIAQTCAPHLRHNQARVDLLQAGVPADAAALYYDLCQQAGPVWRQHFSTEFPVECGRVGDLVARGASAAGAAMPLDATALIAEQTSSIRQLVHQFLRHGDTAREAELQRVSGELASTRQELEALEQQLALRTLDNLQLREASAQGAQERSRLEGETASQRAEIEQLMAASAAHGCEIQRLNEELTRRQQELNAAVARQAELTAELANASAELANASAELANASAERVLLAEQATARDVELERYATELAAREEALAGLAKERQAWEEQLKLLACDATTRNAELATMRSLLEEREADLHKLSEELAAQTARHDIQIRELQGELAERERARQRLVQELATQDRQTRSFRGNLADERRQRQQLQAEVAHWSRRSAEQLGRCLRLTACVDQMRNERQTMLQSRSWRLTRSLRAAGRGLQRLGSSLRLAAAACYWLLTGQLGRRRQQWSEKRLIRRSGLFRPDWYRRQYPDLPPNVDPLHHFSVCGAAEGRSPCPLFDTAWYLQQYPDVAAAGVNPFVHYLRFGSAEGRNPHPLFDAAWYLLRNCDVAAAGVLPLAHFVREGGREGRSPHPAFDATWYLEQNPDVAAAEINPLEHFLESGAAEGRNPNPHFDVRSYRLQHTDVAAGENALLHCLRHGFPRECGPLPAVVPPCALPLTDLAFPEASSPKVSIIIPVHNQWEHTCNCLTSVRAHSGEIPYEVILADDGSNDATAEASAGVSGLIVVRSEPDPCTQATLGFLRNCNRAATRARGEYLLFLNNDTLVQPGWLDALLGTAEEDPRVGIVGAKLLFADGRLQEAGGIIWSDGSGWNYGRGDNPEKPDYNYVRETDYVSGAALLVRRGLWESIGGFDERFAPAYFEDADLAFECRRRGYKVLYQPQAVVVHLEGVSNGTDLSAGLKRHQVLNREGFVNKWRQILETEHYPNGTDVLRARDHSRAAKHLLYCDWELPDENRDSGSVRTCNVMRVVASLGYRVSFLPANLYPYPGQPHRERLQQRGIFTICGEGVRSLEEVLARYGSLFDVVVIARVNVGEACMELVQRHCPQARLIFDTHDLHFLREQREAELHNDDQLRARARATREKELRFINQVDITLVVSPVEQELLRSEAPGAHVEVAGNIHPRHGSAQPFTARKDLLFIGGFAHRPNVDAVKWLAEEIFPHVRRFLPGVRMQIIGSNPPAEIRALHCADFCVVGYVPDIAPYFNACRLSVVPLRYGAGIKGKINTSMSYGVPVVTTSVGSEGMFLQHGRDVMVADNPVEFAEAIRQLYTDEPLWTQMSSAGLLNIEQHFSFAAARDVWSQVLSGDERPLRIHRAA